MTEWSIRSLTNCISPPALHPLSLPLAHSTLRSLPIAHPFQQRWPTTYAHFRINKDLYSRFLRCARVSSFACHTKLDLTDMKQIHLFNPDRSFALKAQQHGSLTQESFGRKPTVHFRFAFGGWRILTRRRTVCWQFVQQKGAVRGVDLSARLVQDGACACPTVALL